MTAFIAPADERRFDPFVHEGLLYTDPTTFIPAVLQFVYDGLNADEPVLVAAPPANLTLLRERLGPFSDGVRFHDITEAGRNPGRLLPWLLDAFLAEEAGRRFRIITQPV